MEIGLTGVYAGAMKLYNMFDMSLDEWRRGSVYQQDLYIQADNERVERLRASYTHSWDVPETPPGWLRQEHGLNALCERWPRGEFLAYLAPFVELTQAEGRALRKAIHVGDCPGEHSPWGYVTDLDALMTWLADWRCRRVRQAWFERRAQMPPPHYWDSIGA
jgi:hypothetical protein